MPMPMQIVYKLKPLIFSPFSKSKSSSPPLTIADMLLLKDHEEDNLLLKQTCTGSSNGSKPPPRRIASRFFSGFNCGKLTDNDQIKQADDVAPPDHVTNDSDLSPELCGRESNFNVGVGCCLVHVIAESKNELQKMTELKMEMESVLHNVKELLVSKNVGSNDGNGVEEITDFNNNLTSNGVLFDQSSNCDDAPKEEDCLEGMDRLEAELEFELERLQLHLDSGEFSTNPLDQTNEESTVNDISERSYSISYAEVIDTTIDVEEQDYTDSQCGVPPYALERKLHELLATRQEQEIRELKAALECARQELSEKEKEISWWKDTAHLMLSMLNNLQRLISKTFDMLTTLDEKLFLVFKDELFVSCV